MSRDLPTTRRRFLVAYVAALAACVCLSIFWLFGKVADHASDEGMRSEVIGGTTSTVLEEVESALQGERNPNREPQQTTQTSASSIEPEVKFPREQLVIEGKIDVHAGCGLELSLEICVRAEQQARSAPGYRRPVQSGIPFSLDVSELLAGLRAGKGLTVNAYLGTELAGSLNTILSDAQTIVRDGMQVLVLPVKMKLRPAATVRGSIQDEAGVPFEGVGLALYAVVMGADKPNMLSTGFSDAKGEFSLSADVDGHARIAILKTGYRCKSVDLVLTNCVTTDVGRLTIEMGKSISGRVQLPTARDVPHDWRVIFFDPTLGHTFAHGPFSLKWGAEQLRLYAPHVSIAEDGTFSITGLDPGPHQLMVSGPMGYCQMPGVQGSVFTVSAPATNVELFVDTPIFVIEVHSTGKPVDNCAILMSRSDSNITCFTGRDGRAAWFVHAEERCSFKISKPGFKSAEQSEVMPPRGGSKIVRVDLEAVRVGQLLIAAVDEHNEPVSSIGVELRLGNREGSALISRDIQVHEGEAVLDAVEVGEHFIEVRAERLRTCDSLSVPWTGIVRIVEGKQSSVRAVLASGARIELVVMDEAGRSVPARCTIRDRAGQALNVTYCRVDDTQGILYESEFVPMDERSSSTTSALVRPALVPGEYLLECQCKGMQDFSRAITLTKGRVARISMVMSPR